MAELTTPADVLDAAADRLARDGWCQGDYYRGTRSCAEGALLSVHVEPRIRIAACEALFEAVGRTDIPAWNDRTGRTAEEVIAKLREVAAHLRSEGR